MKPSQKQAVQELCQVTLIYSAFQLSQKLAGLVEEMISEDATDPQIIAAVDRVMQDLKTHLDYSRSSQ